MHVVDLISLGRGASSRAPHKGQLPGRFHCQDTQQGSAASRLTEIAVDVTRCRSRSPGSKGAPPPATSVAPIGVAPAMFSWEIIRSFSLYNNEAFSHTARDRFAPRGCTELSQDRTDVKLHGVFGDLQSSSNILVPQPFCQHGQHFQFSGTQCFAWNYVSRGNFRIGRQQRVHVFRAEYDQSGYSALDGSYDLRARSVARKNSSHSGM